MSLHWLPFIAYLHVYEFLIGFAMGMVNGMVGTKIYNRKNFRETSQKHKHFWEMSKREFRGIGMCGGNEKNFVFTTL